MQSILRSRQSVRTVELVRSRLNRRRQRRGFSLLEVLMVIIILGILAAVVAPQFFNVEDRAKQDTASTTVNSGFGGAMDLFRTHMGRYPETLEELLAEPDDEDEAKKWSGPYLKDVRAIEDLTDPWGNEWYYAGPEDAEGNPGSYDLGSNGVNGEWGDDDDIRNWEE